MADVSHELGALRFVVESPLSSKVAMFNNAATKHQESQHLNPFSQSGGLSKRSFNKDEYGKPLAGSLTELRGQKANIHVLKEMLELCQIIDSEGYNVKDEPGMKVIPFGELFNIYTYVSDKVVGILLRARKHKLIQFEGEVLFQRRDDDVPVFLLKPIKEIRAILEQKQDEIKRSVSPAPQATSVLIDKQKRAPSLSPTPTQPKNTNRLEKDIIKPIAKKAISTPNIKAESDKVDDEIQNQIKGHPIAEEPSLKEVSNKISPTEEAKSVPSDITHKPTESAKLTSTLTTNTNIQEQTSEGAQKTTEIILPTPTLPQTIITPPETVITPPTPTAISAPEVKQTLVDIETKPLLVETDTPAVESSSAEVKQTVTKVESTALVIEAATSVVEPTTSIQSEGTAVEPTTPTPDQATHVTASLATEVDHVEDINTSPIVDQKTDLNNNEKSLTIAPAGEQSLNTETEPPANTTTNTP